MRNVAWGFVAAFLAGLGYAIGQRLDTMTGRFVVGFAMCVALLSGSALVVLWLAQHRVPRVRQRVLDVRLSKDVARLGYDEYGYQIEAEKKVEALADGSVGR